MEIFPQIDLLWNFFLNPFFVETVKQSKLLSAFPKKKLIFVEICNAAIFCGNFSTQQINGDTFQTSVFLWKE